MGRLTSLGGLGRIIGIFIGGLLNNSGYGFRNGPLFFVASFVMFISAIPMLFTPEGGIHRESNEKENPLNDEDGNRSGIFIFLIFIIALVFINFGRNSIAVPYSQYLTLESGFNVGDIMLSFIANTRSVAVLIIGFIGFILASEVRGDGKVIINFISTLFIILSIIWCIIYKLKKEKWIIFEYSGGLIMSKCNWYSNKNIKNFMKNVFTQKDKIFYNA